MLSQRAKGCTSHIHSGPPVLLHWSRGAPSPKSESAQSENILRGNTFLTALIATRPESDNQTAIGEAGASMPGLLPGGVPAKQSALNASVANLMHSKSAPGFDL